MKRFSIILMLFLATSALLVGVQQARSLEAVYQVGADEGADPYDIEVVRVAFTDFDAVDELNSWKQLWEVNREKGYFVVDVTPAEREWLESLGYMVTTDIELTAIHSQPNVALPNQGGGIPGFSCYRTVEETHATAYQLEAAYPTLATVVDAGDSWEKTQNVSNGYDMLVLKLTNSNTGGDKPVLMMTSAIHAREYTTAELATRYAEHMLAQYGHDADVTWLLDYHEIHLMLQSNPDGRKFAETGLSWRKNTNTNYCSPTSTSRGADLNRNFEFFWDQCDGVGCSSGNQCSNTYRGPAPASEPETQAIQSYGQLVFPDWRDADLLASAPMTATGVYIDIHSFSQLVLWPWGFTDTVAPNGVEMQTLGRKLAHYNDYTPQQAIELYPTDGTTDDFFYGDLGIAAYTYELGTTFFQGCSVFEGTIVPDNMPSLIYAAKAARAPYMIPAGPDTTDVTLIGGAVEAGVPLTVNANLSDIRFNNSNGVEPSQVITAAEFYIDVPDWDVGNNPVAVPMSATDGAFDASEELATATLDTTGLAPGRHTVYVRGQDSDGNWGAVTAQFFYIVDAAVAPTIRGYVLEVGTGTPLFASIDVGGIFATTSNPATGYYELQVISGTYDITIASVGYAEQSMELSPADFGVTEVDFDLSPFCTVYTSAFENGEEGWTAQAPWALSSELSHSPTMAWTESPGGNYGNNRNISLTSPIFDLSGQTHVTLNYWQICDTESGWDFCIVEARPSTSSGWTELARWSGNRSSWEEVQLDASVMNNGATAQFRFRFTSDTNTIDDGWHLDDVNISAIGGQCSPVRLYLPSTASEQE